MDIDGSHDPAAVEDDNGCNLNSEVQPSTGGQPERYNHQNSIGSTKRFSDLESNLMLKAASKGDWQAAEMLLWMNPKLASAPITSEGDTALHVAVAHKHVKFVEEIVKQMKPSDLLLKNQKGYTALFSAAASVVRDRSNRDMVSCLMRYTDPEKFQGEELYELLGEELYELLLRAISSSMDGSTKKISEESNLAHEDASEEFSEESNQMHGAASKGDWQAAKKLLKSHPNLASAQITGEGDTVLHIAVAYKHEKFVRKLVGWMPPRDLELQNQHGYTESLLTKHNRNGMTPLGIAVYHGKRDMVPCLLNHTVLESLPREELFKLMKVAISNSMYDVALKILQTKPDLATEVNIDGTALHLLAQEDISDISACQEAILERLLTLLAAVPCLPSLKKKFEKPLMRKKARRLAEKLWDQFQHLETEYVLKLMNNPPILFEAAEVGNAELISMLTRTHPRLIWHTMKDNNYTIFHIAVLERQESILRLIHQLEVKHAIADSYDDDGNNILHLAAKRAPLRRRLIVSGPAFQMQRELMWFKELEKILPPFCRKIKNKDGLQPRELFTIEHRKLLKEGEIWLRETANSCMLIATIMLTMVFAAAFTVPGGNNSEIGIPILLKRTWFKVFVISDVIAMFCATFSISMFLSILTSRFREKDFRVSLPRKLVFGILGLFGSLVGAISAFTSSSILMLNVESAWLPRMLGYFACVFLTMVFLLQHIGLISEVISASIYRPMYLFP